MPATGPIPPEVGKCFDGATAGNYGRDLISSGPYMVKGEDGIDATSCATIKPTDGYDGADGTHITLVRNPNYSQATDKYRKNYPDEFDFTIDSNADDIFQQGAGRRSRRRDLAASAEDDPRSTSTDPSLKSHLLPERRRPHQLHHDEPDAGAVRRHPRAQGDELIIDKASLQQGLGRLGRRLDRHAHRRRTRCSTTCSRSYDPYKTPGEAGSVSAGREGDEGLEVRHEGRRQVRRSRLQERPPRLRRRGRSTARMLPIIQADAAKIGITFKVRSVNGAYPVINTPKNNIPISDRPSWGKDYGDPGTFFTELFLERHDPAEAGTRTTRSSASRRRIAKTVGATGTITGVPSADTADPALRHALGRSQDRLLGQRGQAAS